MCWGTMIAKVLVLVGAVNWGLVGLGGFLEMNLNVVNLALGAWPQVEWVVYLLVGVAGVFKMVKCAKGCKGGSCETKAVKSGDGCCAK